MPMTPVARSVDFCLVPAPTPHKYYGAATNYASPSLGLAIEAPPHTPMKWPPGMVTGAHKLASSVMNRMFKVVQGGHKLGPLVIHMEIAPGPDDLLTIVQMLTSSFEVKFQNSECRAQGNPLGSILPSLMNCLVCTDAVSLPLGYSLTSLLNSAWHNTSWTDVIAGHVEILVTQIIEALILVADGGANPSGGSSVSPSEVLSDALTPSIESVVSGAFAGTASSLAGAAVRWIGREHFDFRGPIAVQTGANVGMFGGEQLEYVSNPDGSWSIQESRSGPLGWTTSTNQYGEDAAGNRSFQHTERVGPVTHQETVSEQRNPDGSTSWNRQSTTSDSIFGLSHDWL